WTECIGYQSDIAADNVTGAAFRKPGKCLLRRSTPSDINEQPWSWCQEARLAKIGHRRVPSLIQAVSDHGPAGPEQTVDGGRRRRAIQDIVRVDADFAQQPACLRLIEAQEA